MATMIGGSNLGFTGVALPYGKTAEQQAAEDLAAANAANSFKIGSNGQVMLASYPMQAPPPPQAPAPQQNLGIGQQQYQQAMTAAQAAPSVVVGGTPMGQTAMQGITKPAPPPPPPTPSPAPTPQQNLGIGQSQYQQAMAAAQAAPSVVVGGTPMGQTAMQGIQQPTAPAPAPVPAAAPAPASANLGIGSSQPQSYTKNPYLDQMAAGITSQMNDNWTRNQLPSIRSGAMAAGGFGGSRQGVVEANALNDMNRSLGQNLTNLYGTDYNNWQNRNLQQQSINNSYDLGLRSSDLGFSNLDANINQNNFQNQLASANFGMGVYNTLNNQTQAGIQAGTNIQNTPLDYQKYFTNSANGVGSGYGISNTSQTNQGNPWLGAIGGAQIGNQIQKMWG